MGGLVLEGSACWLDNLLLNSEGEKELRRATERVTEGRSWQRRLWPQTEIILKLIFFKNTLPNGLADSLGMKKLEL